MHNNGSTYRFQFHEKFSFNDARNLIPYLNDLGIETLYASPVFLAVPGSNHGYDALDASEINPEIGTLKEYIKLSKNLNAYEMGLMQDIVPNHMAFDSRNPWIMDLLEYGDVSSYYRFFDIFFPPSAQQPKLMLPFLGMPLKDAIGADQIAVRLIDNRLVLSYYDTYWPLGINTYSSVLTRLKLPGKKLKSLLETDTSLLTSRNELQSFHLAFKKFNEHGKVGEELNSALAIVSKNKSLITKIVANQFYRLCSWQETDKEINFRRFFTVNSLICLNIQESEVFQKFHHSVKFLLEKKIISSLRVDHIDGLYDPGKYLNNLRELSGKKISIYVEKILAYNEILLKKWPVQGTTGYDFLAKVNNLFTCSESKDKFWNFAFVNGNNPKSSQQILIESKKIILDQQMGGELENLCSMFIFLSHNNVKSSHKSERNLIRSSLKEILARLPVYRYYGNQLPVSDIELMAINQIINEAKKEHPSLRNSLESIRKTLLKIGSPGAGDQEELGVKIAEKGIKNTNVAKVFTAYELEILIFYQRLMQFTGPVMAKGIEDTLMYRSTLFIGHNEVGDSPFSFGIHANDFHSWIDKRFADHPLDMNATSTHDTKRGEDVRARLNTLSEIPELWFTAVNEWKKINASLKDENFPGDSIEYFIYQNLSGSYPYEEKEIKLYTERICAYLQKSLREGKHYSSWSEPAKLIEQSVEKFITSILNPDHSFLRKFLDFQKDNVDFGMINSLSQLTLKCMLPGVPDIYQGSELWDLSLVDPDNRRRVNYVDRKKMLDLITSHPDDQRVSLLRELWKNRTTGGIKLFLTHILLRTRKGNPQFFEKAGYVPLAIKGLKKDSFFAFMRKMDSECMLIIVPLFPAKLKLKPGNIPGEAEWADTSIVLPERSPSLFTNIITGKEYSIEREIRVGSLMDDFPVLVLKSKAVKSGRSAGVLMHISSLPSAYGIGDLGPQAFKFADFLSQSKQTVWQFLPIGPTGEDQFYSPYSAFSSLAGNTLFISLDLLAENALIDKKELQHYKVKPGSKIDFHKAIQINAYFLEKAYTNYFNDESIAKDSFIQFCDAEKEWLDDFAAFVVIKEREQNRPWYNWRTDFKNKSKTAIQILEDEFAPQLNKIKWYQFIFFSQWNALKSYSKNLGIYFIGDLPFYSAYDSCDVWSNRGAFLLDDDGGMLAQAGVPPDYFNADGQLWGMPVYNWKNLVKDKFAWWIQRINGNIKLYDLIRLDHFRAMYNYWEVPCFEETARNGKWELAPGEELLKTLQSNLPDLPFIAEDLGEMNAHIYDLRDRFKLPGMKIMQFAFGEDSGKSPHIPHNYTKNSIAYTGTHDNNTSLGWYNSELDKKAKKRLQQYAGKMVKRKNVAQILSRLAYGSVAQTIILPIQDILRLGEIARMNKPATVTGNWEWRMKPGSLTKSHSRKLRNWVILFNRY